MENQYGQALNTHARFNAYASSPSIETSERIHNRRQAKLNYLCSLTHTVKGPFAACTAYILHNYIRKHKLHTYVHIYMLALHWQITQVRVRRQLRGKQKQKKSKQKAGDPLNNKNMKMLFQVYECVSVYVLVSRQRSSICTTAGKWQVSALFVFDLTFGLGI